MTSTQHLEMEIDLLEKKKKAMESDLRYKEYQYNKNMPCDEGMFESDAAILVMSSMVRDRDRLDVEIAEKRMRLYELQGGDVSEQSNPTQVESLPTTHPKTERGWYHYADKDGRGYFLAFVNAKGSCSMSRFDASSGIALGKEKNRKGDYRDSFSDYIGQAIPLHLSRQPSLVRARKNGLPPATLGELRQQIEPKP